MVCGTLHDWDVNAAKNILMKGMLSRAVGTGLQGGQPHSGFAAGRGCLAAGISVLSTQGAERTSIVHINHHAAENLSVEQILCYRDRLGQADFLHLRQEL